MSNARKDAWQNLVNAAARAVRDDFSREAQDELSQSAKGWAAQNGYRPFVSGDAAPEPIKGTRGNTLRSGHVMPFGRSKSKPIEEAGTDDLVWMSGVLREGLDDPSKERFREKNQALLSAIEAEISTR